MITGCCLTDAGADGLLRLLAGEAKGFDGSQWHRLVAEEDGIKSFFPVQHIRPLYPFNVFLLHLRSPASAEQPPQYNVHGSGGRYQGPWTQDRDKQLRLSRSKV